MADMPRNLGLELIPVEKARQQLMHHSRNKEVVHEPNMLNGAVAQISTRGVRDLETGKIVQNHLLLHRAENNNPNDYPRSRH